MNQRFTFSYCKLDCESANIWVILIHILFVLLQNVRVTKENRAAGVLDNFAEGEKYSQHVLRKYVRNKSPEIMPSINGFFAKPDIE